MIFQRLKNHYEFISAKLTEIEKQLSHLPPGQLNCWSVNGQSKYYLSQNHKRTYLSSKNEFLIQQLALKKYLTALQKELLAEEKALRPYIHFMQTPHSSATKMLLPDSPLHSLLSPQLLSVSKEANYKNKRVRFLLVLFIRNRNESGYQDNPNQVDCLWFHRL